MITWIAASHDQQVLEANLLASFPGQTSPATPTRPPWPAAASRAEALEEGADCEVRFLPGGDQLLIIRNATSIARAYRYADLFTRPGDIRCYLHQDVRILDLAQLRLLLHTSCRADAGIVGVIGSAEVPAWDLDGREPPLVCPWWDAPARVGSVRDSRLGLLNFSPGDEPAEVVDGLLLATCQPIAWDTDYEGWHLYDHDACAQMLDVGLTNWVLPAGHELVEHNTTGPTSLAALTGWAEGVARFDLKWRA